MSLKNLYYSLSKEEFEKYLEGIKNNPDTIHIFSKTKTPYFFYPSKEITSLMIALNKALCVFDELMNHFSHFGKNQLLQYFLIEEIQATNQIENIHSTKHDIFSLMNNITVKKDNEIKSIIKTYQLLLTKKTIPTETVSDIRNIYDQLILDTLSKEDIPDGEFFRKNAVYISNGNKSIHEGFYPEESINDGMKEFLSLYNSSEELFLRMILTHFMIETIHPFYDGNGRLGRFLFTNKFYSETKSVFSFLISNSLNTKKNKYYSAFKEADDIHEFGCLNGYVKTMMTLLLEKLNSSISFLSNTTKKLHQLNSISTLSKSEAKIYSLLQEATLLSAFGLNSFEILKETKVSKRTLVYTLNKFKEQHLLTITKIGKYHYLKLNKVD